MSQPEESYIVFPDSAGGFGLVKADAVLRVVEFKPSDITESDRKFGGWMTVEVRDRQGDVVMPEGITVEEYIKVMGGPLLDMHRNKPIGRLTKMELRPKKLKDGVEKMGVYVEGFIFKGGERGFRDYPNWKNAWEEIKSSFRDGNPVGLSLGGDPEGTYIRCKEGSCERVVKVTYLEEVSLVRRSSRPANPESFLDKHNTLAKAEQPDSLPTTEQMYVAMDSLRELAALKKGFSWDGGNMDNPLTFAAFEVPKREDYEKAHEKMKGVMCVESVAMDKIRTSQKKIDRDTYRKHLNKFSLRHPTIYDAKLPILYKKSGLYHVIDGNHDIAALHQLQRKDVPALVYDMDKLADMGGSAPQTDKEKDKTKDGVVDATLQKTRDINVPFVNATRQYFEAPQPIQLNILPKPATIDIELLVATQKDVDSSKVMEAEGHKDNPIEVHKIANTYYIADGHHRATRAKMSGEKKIKVLLYDFDEMGYVPGKESDKQRPFPDPKKFEQMSSVSAGGPSDHDRSPVKKAADTLTKLFDHQYKCKKCGTESWMDGRLKGAKCSTCSSALDKKMRNGIRFMKAAPITNGDKESPDSPIAPKPKGMITDHTTAMDVHQLPVDGTTAGFGAMKTDGDKAKDAEEVNVEGELNVSRISAAKAMAKMLVKVLLPYDSRVQPPFYRPGPADTQDISDIEDEMESERRVGEEAPEISGQKPSSKRAWRARGESFGTMPGVSPAGLQRGRRSFTSALARRLNTPAFEPGTPEWQRDVVSRMASRPEAQAAMQPSAERFTEGIQGPAMRVASRLQAANPEGYHMSSDEERQFLIDNLKDFMTSDELSPYIGEVPEGIDPTLAGMVQPQQSRVPRRVQYMLSQMPQMKRPYGTERGQPMFSPEDIQATREYLEGMFYGGVPREAFYAPAQEGFAGLKEHARWPEIRDFRTALLGAPSMGEVDENTGFQRPIHYPNPQQGLRGYVMGRTRGRGQATGYADREFTPTEFKPGEKIPLTEMARAFNGASSYARQRQEQRETESRHRAAVGAAGALASRSGVPISSGRSKPAPSEMPASEKGPGYRQKLEQMGLKPEEIANIMDQQDTEDAAAVTEAAKKRRFQTAAGSGFRSAATPKGRAALNVLGGERRFPGSEQSGGVPEESTEKYPGSVFHENTQSFEPVPTDEFQSNIAGDKPLPYGTPAQRMQLILREAQRYGVSPHDLQLPPGVELPESDTRVAPIDTEREDSLEDATRGISEDAETDVDPSKDIYVPVVPEQPHLRERLLRRGVQLGSRAAGRKWTPNPVEAPKGYKESQALSEKIGEGQMQAITQKKPVTMALSRGLSAGRASRARMTRNIPAQTPPQSSAAQPTKLPASLVSPKVVKPDNEVHVATKKEPSKVTSRVRGILIGRPRKPEGKPTSKGGDATQE